MSGVRRCGKSTLLKLLVDKISGEVGAPGNIFHRRMDGFGVPLDPDAAWFEAELAAAMEKADSNAHALSSGLSTLLGGRYTEIPVQPLSFSGYASFVEQADAAGKQVLRPLRKFYPVDAGLRNLSTGFASRDLGKRRSIRSGLQAPCLISWRLSLIDAGESAS